MEYSAYTEFKGSVSETSNSRPPNSKVSSQTDARRRGKKSRNLKRGWFFVGPSRAKPVKTRRGQCRRGEKVDQSERRREHGANPRNLLNSLSVLWELGTPDYRSSFVKRTKETNVGRRREAGKRTRTKMEKNVKRELTGAEHLRERVYDQRRIIFTRSKLLLSYLFLLFFYTCPVIAISCRMSGRNARKRKWLVFLRENILCTWFCSKIKLIKIFVLAMIRKASHNRNQFFF